MIRVPWAGNPPAVALAEVLVETLKPYEKEWRGVLDARSKKSLEELKAYRAGKIEEERPETNE